MMNVSSQDNVNGGAAEPGRSAGRRKGRFNKDPLNIASTQTQYYKRASTKYGEVALKGASDRALAPSRQLVENVFSFNDLKHQFGLPKAIFLLPPSLVYPHSVKVELYWSADAYAMGPDDGGHDTIIAKPQHALAKFYNDIKQHQYHPLPFDEEVHHADQETPAEVWFKLPRTVDKRALQSMQQVLLVPGARINAMLLKNQQAVSFTVVRVAATAAHKRRHTGSFIVDNIEASGELVGEQALLQAARKKGTIKTIL
jgi:hypothetical protein